MAKTQSGRARGNGKGGSNAAKNARNAKNTNSKTTKPAPKANTNPNDARGILFMLAAVLVAILHFTGDSNGLLKAMHTFAEGLAGSLTVIFPLLLVWLGIRGFRASRRGQFGASWIIMPLCVYVCLLTIVQGFYVDEVELQTNILGYANFLTRAYALRRGAGLIGSLLGYPVTKLLTEWGSLIVFSALIIFLLHRDGLLNVFGIASFIGSKSRVAGEKISDAAETMGKRVSEHVKTKSEERKKAKETLFNDEIYRGDANAPVSRYKLENAKTDSTRVSNIHSVGDEYEVPELNRSRKQPKPKKPAASTETPKASPKKPKTDAERNYEETVDLLEEIRREDPKKRNEAFMKNALKDHSTSPKPVLTYDYEGGESGKAKPSKIEKASNADDLEQESFARRESAASKPVDNYTPIKEAAKPEPKPQVTEAKQPQQPLPSFFDDINSSKRSDDGKSVKQNSEQGKPSDTTYVKPPMPQPAYAKPAEKAQEKAPEKEAPHIYYYPPMDLMVAGDTHSSSSGGYDDIDRQRAEVLIKTLQNFSIPVKLTGISHGPAVTRFEILPAPGIKVSKISSYADDIAMALAAVSVRIEAPIPGKNAVGVEVPNVKTEVVHLRDVLESNEARRNNKRLMVGLGKDNSGKYVVADLAGMPHVLIAGQTGSGKSVCINAIIVSILYRANPDEVRMILVDPKMVELNVYKSIPHLLAPVVTDPKKAAGALEWAVGEMQRRYKVFSEHGAKNIESYNAHLGPDEQKMPQIVIIIDELADLMMTSPRDVEDAINRLAQLARAAGMHLVIATQRPSVDVITGLIKANIPTRIAFTVSSGVDSRTILDSYGAEKLLGKGDMLFLPSDRNKPMRLQGAWISEEEVQAIVDHISGGEGIEFDEDMMDHMENAAMSAAEKKDKHTQEVADDIDDLFEEALRCCVEAGQASISMLQRKLRIGYARAGRLIDEMAQRNYVSSSEGSKSREVLITRDQLNQIFSKD